MHSSRRSSRATSTGCTSMLTDDVVHVSDGGPDHHAARRPVRGPDKVARLFVNLARREWLPTDELHWVEVNGQPGAYVVRDGQPYLLTVLNWRDRQVAEAIAIVNPDKLRHFHDSWSNRQLGLPGRESEPVPFERSMSQMPRHDPFGSVTAVHWIWNRRQAGLTAVSGRIAHGRRNPADRAIGSVNSRR